MKPQVLPALLLPLLAVVIWSISDTALSPEELSSPTPAPAPTFLFDAKEDKIVNDAVISAVRKGNTLEVESDMPYVLFYFRAVPPVGEVPKKTLAPGQTFVLRDRHGSISYQVMGFEKAGLRVRFSSNFNLRSFGDTKPHSATGSFIIRFKSPQNSAPKK